MKQVLASIAMLFICFLSVSAQKEVYFNTSKPEDIKVQSPQGIEISSSINPGNFISNLTYKLKSYIIPIEIAYFNEKRIASTWTLLYRIKLQNNISNSQVLSYDSINHAYGFDNNSPYKATYSLGIGINIEPRWYFGYKRRYQVGKAKLNSGWYLSLPVTFGSTIVNTYKSPQSGYYQTFKNYGLLTISPTIGYRQAISKQWFLEGNLQLESSKLTINSFNNKLNISYYYPVINFFPELSLKAAYTFN